MAYVEAKTETSGYTTPEQYVRHLIENDQEEQRRAFEQRLLDALRDDHEYIEVPDEVWADGDIVGFIEEQAAKRG